MSLQRNRKPWALVVGQPGWLPHVNHMVRNRTYPILGTFASTTTTSAREGRPNWALFVVQAAVKTCNRADVMPR